MIGKRSILCKKTISRVALARLSRGIAEKTSSFTGWSRKGGGGGGGILDRFPICRAKILYFPDAGRNENRTPRHRWISHSIILCRLSLCKCQYISRGGVKEGWRPFYIFPTVGWSWTRISTDCICIYSRESKPPGECSAGADAMVNITRAKQEKGRRGERERPNVTNAEVRGEFFIPGIFFNPRDEILRIN